MDVLRRIRELMAQSKLDLLLVADPFNAVYLHKCYEPLHMGIHICEEYRMPVVPLNKDPFIVGFELPGWPTLPEWLSEFHQPEYYTLPSLLRKLKQVLEQKDLSRGRIGVELDSLPVSAFEELRIRLPQAEIVAADSVLAQVRAAKSPIEIGLMKEAVQILIEGVQMGTDALAAGQTLEDAMTRTVLEIARRGAVPYHIPTRSYGYRWGSAESERQLREYEENRLLRDGIFRRHLNATYQGYWADIAWQRFIPPAQPDERWMEKYLRMRTKQRTILEQLRVGMDAKQAQEACSRALREGFSGEIPELWWAHSIGLQVHEEPIIGALIEPREGVTIPQNCVMCVELFDGGIWGEDMFLMTEEGWQPLHPHCEP